MSRGILYSLAGALRPIDRLRARLGLWRAPGEVPEDVAALLVAVAERFLRAGGSLSLPDWGRLSVPERAAFVAAGDRVAADRAGVVGVAAQGLRGALAVHGVLDGGRMRVEAEDEAAVARLASPEGPLAARRDPVGAVRRGP